MRQATSNNNWPNILFKTCSLFQAASQKMKAELLFAKCQFSHSVEPFLKLVSHKSVVIFSPSDQSYIEHITGFQLFSIFKQMYHFLSQYTSQNANCKSKGIHMPKLWPLSQSHFTAAIQFYVCMRKATEMIQTPMIQTSPLLRNNTALSCFQMCWARAQS